MSVVTLKEQITELEREMKMRVALYPGFVRRKTLSEEAAGRQIVSRKCDHAWSDRSTGACATRGSRRVFRFGEAVFAQWNLEGAVERFHCERMVQAAWRLRRSSRGRCGGSRAPRRPSAQAI